MSQGKWEKNIYTIDIKKLHKGMASVRDDTLEKIKTKKGFLRITLNGRLCLELSHDRIDSKIAFRGFPEPSIYGIPYRFCYFHVDVMDNNQGRLL